MSVDYDYDQKPEYFKWAAEKLDIKQFRSDAVCITMLRDNEIAAVAVYDTFVPGDCLMHIASDGTRRWATREFRQRTFIYPFIQCKLQRVTASVSENNFASRKFCTQLGFVEEGRLREAGTKREDLIIFGMLQRECRWVASNLIFI